MSNKDDLISRSALREEFKARCICNCDRCKYQKGAYCGLIDDAPTIDIPNYGGRVVPDTLQGWRYEEIPQGEWITDEDSIFESYKKCSNCNEDAEWLDGGSQFLSNFCPNCGAYMRGKKND